MFVRQGINRKSKQNRIVAAACEALEVRRLLSTVYVDLNSPGPTHDGSSWAKAYTDLQPALTAAVSGETIDVAQGTYYPTSGTSRTATFQLKSGVEIDGGFAGAVNPTAARNVTAYPTILSGDIGVPGNTADNSYHVVSGSNTDATAILDGVTVTGGNANGTYPNDNGGGIYDFNGSPVIRNCTITANAAVGTFQINDDGGGGMYSFDSLPTLTNCVFSHNSAVAKGGALVFDNGVVNSDSVSNCVFFDNTAAVGGGIYSVVTALTVNACSFYANTATSGGGAMFNDAEDSVEVTNCIFVGNSAPSAGAVGAGNDTRGGFDNCTFTDNDAGSGSALYFASFNTITNCILWGNIGSAGEVSGSLVSVVPANSDVDSGRTQLGNINADPLFTRSPNAGPDGKWGTDDDDDGNLQLLSTSPCINVGSNTAVPAGVATDAAGFPRIVGAAVDLGAYEFQSVPYSYLVFTQEPSNPVAGQSFNPIVVEAENSSGAVLPGVSITLSLNGTSESAVAGTLTEITDSGGMATFSGLSMIVAGSYSLTASGGALSAQSSEFMVTPASPASLTFVQQPTSVTAGIVIAPPITVQTSDQYGNLIGGDQVTLALVGAPGVALTGTLTQTSISSGISTFSNLSIRNAGRYTLSASDANLVAVSLPFSIFPSQLKFVQSPPNMTAGQGAGPGIIQVLDATGAPVAGVNMQVNVLSVSSGQSVGSLNLTTDVNGLATFNGFILTSVGMYELQAIAGSLTAVSTAFSVSPAAVASISFGPFPTTVSAGQIFQPFPTVLVADRYGNVISGVSIVLSIFSGPSQSLGGTLTQISGSNGVATYGNLFLTTAGNYAIIATDTADAVASAINANVAVRASNPASIALLSQPTASANSPLISSLSVQLRDTYGNLAGGDGVTAALASGPSSAVLQGAVSSTTDANGVATFSGLSIYDLGTYTLVVNAGAVASPATSPFTITGFSTRIQYVDASAHGSGDGSSWMNAATSLGAILTKYSQGTIIEIAQGTYDGAVSLFDGVTLQGGYAGVAGANPNSRNANSYPSILTTSGGGTVVKAAGSAIDSSAVLDGFTITGGSAYLGGGMLISLGASPTIENCDFVANVSQDFGGGGYVDGSPTFTNCDFSQNSAVSGGGLWINSGNVVISNCVFEQNSSAGSAGLIVYVGASATVTNCIFEQNNSTSGAGVLFQGASGVFNDCEFLGNIDAGPMGATTFGGGLGLDGGESAVQPTIALNDCVFCGNSAGEGGAIFANQISLNMYDCTVVDNSSTAGPGGAIYNSNSTIAIANSIIYFNQSDGSKSQSFGLAPTTFSDVANGRTTAGNINVDPQFVRDPSAGPDGIWGTADDDYGNLQLQATSPCVNVGSNTAIPSGTTTDIAGNPRIIDGTVDMGAYECTSVNFSGGGDGHSFFDPNNWSGKVVPGQYDDVTIPAGVTVLTALAGPTNITLSGLTILAGGLFDLADNTLVIDFVGGDPVSSIRGYLQSAFNGGNWLGNSGLTSSVVAAQAAGAKGTTRGFYEIGYADGNIDGSVGGAGAKQIIISPQLAADANEDGQVNFNDLVSVAQNFGSVSGDWVHGDFSYDAIVNFQDLVLLAQNFGKTNGNTLLAAELPVKEGVAVNPVFSDSPIIGAFSLDNDVLESGRENLLD